MQKYVAKYSLALTQVPLEEQVSLVIFSAHLV